MPREYFCAYHSYLKSIELLNDSERGRLFTACLQYSILFCIGVILFFTKKTDEKRKFRKLSMRKLQRNKLYGNSTWQQIKPYILEE